MSEQTLDRSCPEWSMVAINLDNKTGLDHSLVNQIQSIQQHKKSVEADNFSPLLKDFLALPDISLDLLG